MAKCNHELAIKFQEMFVNRPGTPLQSEPLILSLMAGRGKSMAYAQNLKATVAEVHTTSPVRHNTVVDGPSPHYSRHIQCIPPHHRSNGTHPYSRDSQAKCNTPLAESSSAVNGNSLFNNAEEVSVSSTLIGRTGKRRKLTNKYSSVRGMLPSLSDPPLSGKELNRIKRYHTVDLNTDFIANFNYILL